MIVIDDVQIQPAILVDIDRTGGPGPTVVEQADLGGHIDEVIITEVHLAFESGME